MDLEKKSKAELNYALSQRKTLSMNYSLARDTEKENGFEKLLIMNARWVGPIRSVVCFGETTWIKRE